MKKTIISIIGTCLFFTVGCSSNDTGSDNNEKLHLNNENIVEASAQTDQTDMKEFIVRDEVKGNNVYVECVISHFKFSSKENLNEGDGYINLYLNGKKVDEIYTAAFIVKGLPEGEHTIDIELVHNNGTPYGQNKSIDVTI